VGSLLAVLLVLGLWWGRDLLGSGQLQGGALVPAPDAVGAWWALYLQAWHPVGIGSESAPAPYVLLLAVGGTLTLGQPWLLVDLLVLGAVPLCACTAFLLARSAFVDRRVRLGWAACYALVPVLTGAVAQGRLGTLVALVVAPLLASAVLATVRPGRRLPWWQHAARIGVWLTIATAFAPVAYVLGAGAILLTAVWWPRLGALPGLLGGLAVPWVLLGSWMAEAGHGRGTDMGGGRARGRGPRAVRLVRAGGRAGRGTGASAGLDRPGRRRRRAGGSPRRGPQS
jgi:hypothetical protein